MKKPRTYYPCWRCLKMHKPLEGARVVIYVRPLLYAELPGCICKRCIESFKEWILAERNRWKNSKEEK